jgi:hypothetical protein
MVPHGPAAARAPALASEYPRGVHSGDSENRGAVESASTRIRLRASLCPSVSQATALHAVPAGRPALAGTSTSSTTCLTRALAEDDTSEECAILGESGARPGVLWFAS